MKKLNEQACPVQTLTKFYFFKAQINLSEWISEDVCAVKRSTMSSEALFILIKAFVKFD